MAREVRKLLGQSPFAWPLNCATRPSRVMSSNAAEASALK